jgi:DNA recombination-dependent growth factor C
MKKCIKYFHSYALAQNHPNSAQKFIHNCRKDIFFRPEELQIRSHGWGQRIDKDRVLITVDDSSIGEYVVAQRKAPSVLIKAHYDDRMEQLKSAGAILSKREAKQLKDEIRQKLDLQTPPSFSRVLIVMNWKHNTLWVWSDKKNDAEKAIPLILESFLDCDIQLTLNTFDTNNLINTLLLNPARLGENVVIESATLGNPDKSTLSLDDMSDVTFRQKTQWVNQGYSALMIKLSDENRFNFKLNDQLDIYDINPNDKLTERWYENGDPNASELLSAALARLWIEGLTHITAQLDALYEPDNCVDKHTARPEIPKRH